MHKSRNERQANILDDMGWPWQTKPGRMAVEQPCVGGGVINVSSSARESTQELRALETLNAEGHHISQGPNSHYAEEPPARVYYYYHLV